MHVLVTGGAGFIGSTLIDRLVNDGHRVTTIDDLSTGRYANIGHLRGHPAFRWIELDLTTDDLMTVVLPDSPDVVVHLAAQVSVRQSVANPQRDAELNVIGTIRLLEAARHAAVEKFVFATSGGCIYGQPELTDLPVPEAHPTEPHSPYGASKLSGELFVQSYGLLHALAWTSLAFANVYGPRQDPHGEAGVVSIFAERMLRGDACTIFGDGEQSRDFIHVRDVVDAIIRACARGEGARFNIGSGSRTSVNDLHERLTHIVGSDRAPQRAPARKGELAHISIDPTKARRQLGWEPTINLDVGLAETVEWVRRSLPSN